MSHPNAPLTVEERRRLVVRIASGVPIAHVAVQMGVSHVTASKWWHRYKDEDKAGMEDQSSRPHCCPTALEARWAKEIEDMRHTHKWSTVRISFELEQRHGVRHPPAHCGLVARAPGDQPQEGPGPHRRIQPRPWGDPDPHGAHGCQESRPYPYRGRRTGHRRNQSLQTGRVPKGLHLPVFHKR